MDINAEVPKIDEELNIQANIDIPLETEFLYNNESEEEKIIEFTCSHPEILKILKPVHVIRGKEKVKIEINIQPFGAHIKENGSVFIYAVDKESGKTKVFLISLKY